MKNSNIKIEHVSIDVLRPCEYNPRRWDKEVEEQLKESINRFGIVDPLLVNSADERKNIVIGGHFRLSVFKSLGIKIVPVVYINIPDIEKEKELNIRLNLNTGDFDFDILKTFDETFLSSVGFSSEELASLNIKDIKVRAGDIYDLNGSRLMCGDSTVEADIVKLMEGEKADMCLTDPPYILDYLKGKKKQNGKVTEGFGLKRDRIYLGTESLPDNFSDLWMANITKIQKPDFSIIIYENPKNLRTIWNALEVHWKYRNTIVWHLPNRVQGFAAKYKFFNKYDFAMVGTSGDVGLNTDPESDDLLQTEYETALFATSGSPHWESYGKGKKYCPTDHIEFKAADKKSSGQGIIFGTKPIEILIPYIKILTKRDDLIVEPFSGSGSTLIAATKMKRRCYGMEKSPVYAEVILNRWSKLTGITPKKIHGN